AVEQLHGGLDLPLPYAELLGDPAFDGPCCWGPGCRHDPVPPSSTEVARQLWQVTATIGDQGADAPGSVRAAVTPGGCACWRRPRRRAGPVPGREGSRRWRWRRRSGGERLRWHGTRAFLSSAAVGRRCGYLVGAASCAPEQDECRRSSGEAAGAA